MRTEKETEEAIIRTTNEINKAALSVAKARRELDGKEKYLEELKRRLNKLQGKCFYVYIVYVDGEAKYVGKGTGDRYKHPVSGASSVPELNRDFFEGKHMEVCILYDNKTMTEDEALKWEKDVIGSLTFHRLYNKVVPKHGEYSFYDTDFKNQSKMIIRNKDYKYQWKDTRFEEKIYDGIDDDC